MKKVIKKISWWLVLPFFCLIVLFSCKSREKAVQKTETQSEKKSEASFKIEDRTFEIVSDKSLFQKNFSYKNSSEESSKQEKKNTEKGKEYWENGNLKKEWERDFSELSESTKSVIEEISEKLTKETENSKYWENSSNHYYQLLEEEKSKTKNYQMQLKAVPKNNWHWWLLIGFLVGFSLPFVWRWFKSWLLRFNPYLEFLDWLNRQKSST